ncbi:MAG: hypothetical protein QM752_07450 [Gammaproteobacteria bacterium]
MKKKLVASTFWKGMISIFDIVPDVSKKSSDFTGLQNDWNNIGKDFRKSVSFKIISKNQKV